MVLDNYDERCKMNAIVEQFPYIHREYVLKDELMSALIETKTDVQRTLYVMVELYIDMVLALPKDTAAKCLSDMSEMMEQRL
jgi:hypothetical protein